MDRRLELPSNGGSEEQTEPFSQPDMDPGFKGHGMLGYGIPLDGADAVHLDHLHVEDVHRKQGVRILVRPLKTLQNTRSVSPGSDNCQWLALRAEVASSDQPEHKVLAVTQTAKDIKFSVRIPGEDQQHSRRPPLWCELYYDPASDKVIFLNKSDVPILLARLSQPPPATPENSDDHVINPGQAKALKPGTWRIKTRDVAVLDFRVLEKRPMTIYEPIQPLLEDDYSAGSSDLVRTSSKRSLDMDGDDIKRSKRRVSDAGGADDNVIVFLQPSADPLVFPLPHARQGRELSAINGHALLDANQDETVTIPGVCEWDEYQLTKRERIASTALSAVYTAEHSRVPENIVTVKVLKTRVPNPQEKPHVLERNVIRQADMWLRECKSQEELQHDSIVRYYGGDARFLSLYMEHVDAQDLTAAPRWRNTANDEFQGTRGDAKTILEDISGALSYIHSRNMVHNDIKPANILYSPERGAVLCDFGLSTPSASSPAGGGTPYYVPPEFIGRKQRGPPSDVWALGVTMLYVLRKIPFPDGRARQKNPRPLYWLITGINNPSAPYKQYGNGQPAMIQMREWLTEINAAREKLDIRDPLNRLVKDMLIPNPTQRITMAKVLQGLQMEQQTGVR